jgi:integrase/recombinase XerD
MKDFKNEHSQLVAFGKKVDAVIDGIPIGKFSLSEFKEQYKNKDAQAIAPETESVADHFKKYQDAEWDRDKVKNALGYQSARASFEAFKPKMLLSDISTDTLKDYRHYMKKNGKSLATTGMYLRKLRTIFLKAIEDRVLSADTKSPFGRNKFVIPTSPRKKNPLSTVDLNKLIKYKPDNEEKQKAKDFWLLCFYCGGRNAIDLLYLKYNDVTAKTITFTHRQKTEDTDENQQPVVVPISKEIKDILNRQAQKKVDNDTYVFSVLNDKLDASQIVNRRHDFLRDRNEGLKLIAADLKIEPFKMQQSRHTALNELRRRGADMSQIQIVAGHKSEKTTDIYMESMNNDVNDTLSLLSSKKQKRSNKLRVA